MLDYAAEEEVAWRKSRELAWEVYGVVGRGNFGEDHRAKNSIRRAAFAVMANIAEGFERGGTVEFYRYLSIAKDELHELRRLLFNAVEVRQLRQESVASIEKMASELGFVVSGLMAYVCPASIQVDNVSEAVEEI